MKNFLIQCLSSSGKVSSKRLITLMSFILMAIGFISNLFWAKNIDPIIYDSMKWIVLGGLGFTASEKFSSKGGDVIDSQINNNSSNQQVDEVK